MTKIGPMDFGQWFWLAEFRALTNFGDHRDGDRYDPRVPPAENLGLVPLTPGKGSHS